MTAPAPSARKRKVLIIDDEKELVEMLALRFEASGHFEVAKAFDGQKGLELARSLRPDIVLLDVAMPGMDGWEVCQKLREDPRTKDAAVVIMTAGSPRRSEEAVGQTGADWLILKPYDDDELINILKAVDAARSRTDAGA